MPSSPSNCSLGAVRPETLCMAGSSPAVTMATSQRASAAVTWVCHCAASIIAGLSRCTSSGCSAIPVQAVVSVWRQRSVPHNNIRRGTSLRTADGFGAAEGCGWQPNSSVLLTAVEARNRRRLVKCEVCDTVQQWFAKELKGTTVCHGVGRSETASYALYCRLVRRSCRRRRTATSALRCVASIASFEANP